MLSWRLCGRPTLQRMVQMHVWRAGLASRLWGLEHVAACGFPLVLDMMDGAGGLRAVLGIPAYGSGHSCGSCNSLQQRSGQPVLGMFRMMSGLSYQAGNGLQGMLLCLVCSVCGGIPHIVAYACCSLLHSVCSVSATMFSW
jgi:hypothetical protein